MVSIKFYVQIQNNCTDVWTVRDSSTGDLEASS